MKKLTCSYGTTCSLSMMEQDGKPLMLFDMLIDEYTIHLGEKRGDYKFPGNVVVNDKRYFNKEQSDYILKLLEVFIETTCIQDVEANETNRGFKFIEPVDVFGNSISIQESSNVDPAIWFGVSINNADVKVWRNNELVTFEYPSYDILLHDRMHLKMPQAKKLKKIIEELWEPYDSLRLPESV